MEVDTELLTGAASAAGRPLLIAGPCSAESEAQLLETARRLQATPVDYLRAGVWKARTRPASFEGVGDVALPWLRRAGDEYGLRTATEVATAAHVSAALRHGIDLLWIGARTTTNPFSVQEIASALRGVEVPVLVKNPTSPDVALWIGALERVHAAGIRALGAIHRGFAVSGSTRFRNPPMWELAIELRRQLPQLPMIADPSHVTGRREIVGEVAQTALDLGFDGLMIETHPSPDDAWSDAAQQVTPERLGAIMAALRRRRPDADDLNFVTRLEALRAQIDHVDAELLDLLAERMRIVERIAQCKRESNVAALQLTRWQALLDDRVERAVKRGLPADYARALYAVVHAESVRRQAELMADAAGGDDAG